MLNLNLVVGPMRGMFQALVCLGVMALLASSVQAQSGEVTLARDGRSLHRIVIAPHAAGQMILEHQGKGFGQRELAQVPAGEALRRHADTLADYLGRITGSPFEVAVEKDAGRGIVLGLSTDFPELGLAGLFNPADPMRTEEYLIRSHTNGLYLIGASSLALRHAVWDLLHEVGHRQFFPGKAWEIIPHHPALKVTIDRFEKPSYHSRLIWYGEGLLEENAQAYHHWADVNRIAAGFVLNTSHEYNNIRSRNAQAFKDNPQFLAQIDGEHKLAAHAKLNVADPGLQKLVVEDARQWFRDHPLQISKTMDPSDFGGWSNTGPSAELGAGTNQALTLANLVARAINDNPARPRYVGMYAYYQHQAPPTIEVDPHVIISFATRFLRPGQTVEQLIAGWKEQGLKQLGIREYYSVFIWDWGMPDLTLQGGDLAYLQHTIPHYHSQGARFLTSESGESWGSVGLGHYVASHLLWDVTEAGQVDAIVQDFLDRSFGQAREPMARFYALINGKDRPLMQHQMVAQLYNHLAQARKLAAGDAPVLKRIDDLVLYVRYVELMRTYQTLKTRQLPRQDAYEAVIRHGYRMRDAGLIHLAGLYRRDRLGRADREMKMPEQARWDVPEQDNPWKDSTPFTTQEIESFLASGRQLAGEDLTGKLVLAAGEGSSHKKSNPQRMRDGVIYLVHAQAGRAVELQVNTYPLGLGWPPAYRVVTPSGQVAAQGQLEVRGDAAIHFQARETGTHWLYVEPTVSSTRVTSSLPVAALADAPSFGRGYIHLYRPNGVYYFRVPAGVARTGIRVLGQGRGEVVQATLIDAAGREVASKDRISGTESHLFVIDRPADAPAQTWGVRIGPATEGYFEDAYLQLSPELPPVVSNDPAAVFEIR